MTTPQAKGYAFDHELARMVGGERHVGSGNRPYARLDASGHTLIFSGKYTGHASFSVTEHDLDEMERAVLGPESAKAGIVPILAVKFESERKVAVLELDQLLSWIRQPPALVPATKAESIDRTARTPSLLRGE